MFHKYPNHKIQQIPKIVDEVIDAAKLNSYSFINSSVGEDDEARCTGPMTFDFCQRWRHSLSTSF